VIWLFVPAKPESKWKSLGMFGNRKPGEAPPAS
jgi:hypothetical protein